MNIFRMYHKFHTPIRISFAERKPQKVKQIQTHIHRDTKKTVNTGNHKHRDPYM